MSATLLLRTVLLAMPRSGPGPTTESAFARMLRMAADRDHLRELDPRLLRDVGLTQEDVVRGVPFGGRFGERFR